ncbi:MAG: GNAT family N-acetyltransferase [Promethearchaeota archaeon]
MTDADLVEVRSLWQEVGFTLSFSDRIDELKKMLRHNPDLCLISEKSDLIKNKKKIQIVGTVIGGFDGRRGWIHHLSVLPLFQGRGLGKILMEELTNRFKQKGIVKLKLEILRENKMYEKIIGFYNKLGWDLRSDLATMSKTLKK